MTNETFDGNNNPKVSTVFWVIGAIALLWNLMGLGSFIAYATISDDAMELMSEAQRTEYQNSPLWLTIVFGIATIGGTLASIALLMRKQWAVLLFIISFVAVIIQFGFGVIDSASVNEGGMGALILPVTVMVVAGLLWFYAKSCAAKGWLN